MMMSEWNEIRFESGGFSLLVVPMLPFSHSVILSLFVHMVPSSSKRKGVPWQEKRFQQEMKETWRTLLNKTTASTEQDIMNILYLLFLSLFFHVIMILYMNLFLCLSRSSQIKSVKGKRNKYMDLRESLRSNSFITFFSLHDVVDVERILLQLFLEEEYSNTLEKAAPLMQTWFMAPTPGDVIKRRKYKAVELTTGGWI